MGEPLRTVVTLELAADASTWERAEEALQALRNVPGVEQLVVKQRLERARWLTVELHLTGPDKAALRRLYDRVSRAAGQSPLRLSGRQGTLSDLFD